MKKTSLISVVIVCSFLVSFNLQAAGKKLTRKAILKNPVEYSMFMNLGDRPDGNGRQGAAIFEDFLFQGHDKGMCHIYELPTGTLLKAVQLLPASALNHANNLCFSDKFFDPEDTFPLLYISENKTSQVAVNRLKSWDADMELVQHITLPQQIGYFLNAVIDTKNNFIYTVCYKNNNWRTSEEGKNHLIVSKLRLPDVSEGNVTIEVIEQFDLPFHVATQGAFFYEGLIIHGFGINSNENDGVRIIDPSKKAIVREMDTHEIFRDEIEGLGLWNGSIIVTTQHGSTYKMDFKK